MGELGEVLGRALMRSAAHEMNKHMSPEMHTAMNAFGSFMLALFAILVVMAIIANMHEKFVQASESKMLSADQAINDLGALMLQRELVEQYWILKSRSSAVIYARWLSRMVAAMSALEASVETSAKAKAAHAEWCRAFAASDKGWYVARSQFTARRDQLCQEWGIVL